MANGTCSIEGCDGVTVARGWCRRHYYHWRQQGDPLAGRTACRGGVDERFWSKVVQQGECWVWTASKDHDGYGKFGVGHKLTRAHRWAYESMIADIPDGLVIDHLCRNHACVNPYHMEPVTIRVNNRRGDAMGRRTTCRKGHLMTLDNTLVSIDRATGYEVHRCRKCRMQSRALRRESHA